MTSPVNNEQLLTKLNSDLKEAYRLKRPTGNKEVETYGSAWETATRASSMLSPREGMRSIISV